MPIKLRRGPEPRTNAMASKMPIQTAKNKAVDTEDSCSFSAALLKDPPLLSDCTPQIFEVIE